VEYVMVPVPEELADDVLTLLSWKGRPSFTTAQDPGNDEGNNAPQSPEAVDAEPAGTGPIARGFATLDAASRALLAAISVAALDQNPLSVPEAARRAGLSPREVAGTIVEVNDVISSHGGPRIVVYLEGRGGPDAPEFDWGTRLVMMNEPTAREVAGLARAAHQD
jgi:hypothetical protein